MPLARPSGEEVQDDGCWMNFEFAASDLFPRLHESIEFFFASTNVRIRLDPCYVLPKNSDTRIMLLDEFNNAFHYIWTSYC